MRLCKKKKEVWLPQNMFFLTFLPATPQTLLFLWPWLVLPLFLALKHTFHLRPFSCIFFFFCFCSVVFLTTVAENKTPAARAATSRTHWHLLRTLTGRRGGYGKGSEVLAHRGAGRGSHVPVYGLLRPGLSPCLLGWEPGVLGLWWWAHTHTHPICLLLSCRETAGEIRRSLTSP